MIRIATVSLIITCFMAVIPEQTVSAPPSKDRHRRTHLLEFRAPDGNRKPITSPGQWQSRRDEIVRAMQQIMGPLPPDSRRCPLDVNVIEEIDCGSYVRRLIDYESEPGSRVPAYLTLPKRAIDGGSAFPAVLCLHPTDNVNGHKVVHGLGGRDGRQYAKELSERGYVTLSPAYPLLANYQPDLDRLGYKSGTMKAIWDNMRGIDLLESLENVQIGKVAAIGHSLGGHNAIFTAVFDLRIQVIVSSCGFDSFVDYKDGDIRGWTSTRYMPRLLDYENRLEQVPFDFPELIGCLAPRYCFINAPLHDSNFKAASVDRVVTSSRTVYELLRASHRLQVVHPDCDHNFPQSIREQAYRLFDQVMKGDDAK